MTYDEFGGQWDHVSPPGPGPRQAAVRRVRPGTRIPALLISGALRRSGVDHTATTRPRSCAPSSASSGWPPLDLGATPGSTTCAPPSAPAWAGPPSRRVGNAPGLGGDDVGTPKVLTRRHSPCRRSTSARRRGDRQRARHRAGGLGRLVPALPDVRSGVREVVPDARRHHLRQGGHRRRAAVSRTLDIRSMPTLMAFRDRVLLFNRRLPARTGPGAADREAARGGHGRGTRPGRDRAVSIESDGRPTRMPRPAGPVMMARSATASASTAHHRPAPARRTAGQQLYQHQSVAVPGTRPDRSGRFPEGRLPLFFTSRTGADIIRTGPAPARFALVRGLIDGPRVIGEFLVVRSERRRGVGRAAARSVSQNTPAPEGDPVPGGQPGCRAVLARGRDRTGGATPGTRSAVRCRVARTRATPG